MRRIWRRFGATLAIGHTRYSTTGGSGLRNAQPQLIETLDGPLGLAHNGNLVNAHMLRRELLERGVGLQTSSDTEVMVHLLTGATGDWMGADPDSHGACRGCVCAHDPDP